MFKIGIITLILFPILFYFLGCGKNKSKEEAKKRLNLTNNLSSSPGDFYFVGMANTGAGIYKFNSKNKSVSAFWSNEKQKLIDLSYSPDRKHAFFITASAYGILGVFPFVKNVKLYLLKMDSAKAALVQKIGNGIQIFTSWETDNTFKLVLNSFDSTIASYINQEILIYSEFGRKLVDNTKTYDITKEAYPKPSSISSKLVSPGGEKLAFKSDSSGTWVYLYSSSKRAAKLITKTDQKLNDAEWSPDGKYLVFSTLDISPKNQSILTSQPSTSKLYVCSLDQKKLTKAWNGNGVKNFYIRNNFLIFDDGFDGNSSIHIFNMKLNENVFTIRIKGGCGLRNIPAIPKYGH